MRLATWNINGLRARIELIVHWLRDRQPDAVGLQELKMEDGQFPHDVFRQEGYYAVTHGQKAWNGVAILSREPVEVSQTGLPGQEDFGARLITAKIQDVSFTTVYVPNGKSVEHEDFPRKLAWLEALDRHMRERQGAEPTRILCGDFNICPSPLDTWDEDGHQGLIFHTDAERERFQSILDGGFVDLYRRRYPDERKFSWWDYRGGSFYKNQGLRIDLLLGSLNLIDRVREVTIDRDYRKKIDGLTASDHTPVMVDLD